MEDEEYQQYRIFLLSTSEIIAVKYEHCHGENHSEPMRGEPTIDSEESILLDTCYGTKSKTELLKFWQKQKDYASIHHYSEFYLKTKLQKLEEKLDNLIKRFSFSKVY